MITELLKGFQTKKSLEPLWYIRLRALCAIVGFVGVAVYFVILVMDLSRGEIYVITSQLRIGEDGYNGSIPLPDGIAAITWTFSNQTTNATCFLETKNSSQEIASCGGVLETQELAVGETFFIPNFANPLLLSDYNLCMKGNSSGTCSFGMDFEFPPVDYAIVDNYTVSMSLSISNWFNVADQTSLVPSPSTIYNIGYGDVLSIYFSWTKYIPINGEPYYINVQTSSRVTTLTPSSQAAVIFQYNTATILTNTEKYTSSIGNVLSLIGGLYGGIASVFILLFGMGVVTPWGIVPKYILRQYIIEELREEYGVMNASDEVTCPLIDPIPQLYLKEVTPENFAFAEARLAKLEALLAKYYLDAEILYSNSSENEKMDV